MKTIRRSLRVLGLLLLCLHGIAICEAQTPPVRILPLGDSLTSGATVEGAYRNKLYSLLTTAGYNVDFVGTLTDANNPTLPDRNHQGLGGYRIDQLQAGLPTWLNAIEDPDVVLLMIGTNDFTANFNTATASNRLSGLVSDIATKRPFAKIIVASLPIRTDDPNLETLQVAYNAAIPGIVSSHVAQGRQVSFVDLHAAVPPADLSEGVHPTAAGYEKIADAWLPAITSVITPLGTSNPPAMVRTEPPVDLTHIAVRFSKPLADTSAALANFSLDGGLTISQAVLDTATKRTITLTTSAQTAGKLYTLTVSGVRDRTPQQNLIAAGSKIVFSSRTLQNSNFEAGATAWTMTGNQVVIDATPPYTATSGTKLVVMNGGLTPPDAVITQTFPTVSGQLYLLEFDVGILAFNLAEQRLGVEVAGSSTLLSRVESLFGNSLGNSVWSARGYYFTANSATTALTFRDLSATSENLDLLLDNVRVSAAPAPVNTAPVAVADAYSTNLNTPLTVPAAGVLGNDTDAQSNPLTAVIDANPAHGSVTLNANGGFTYTPAAGYAGADAFTYHANDGLLNSNIVTVSITVNTVIPGALANGSFEAGQTGWTMTGNFLVYGSDGTYLATDGAKMVVMNAIQTLPTAVISQTFATTPGQSYALSFDVGILALNLNEQRLGVTLTGATTLVSQTESLFGNGQGNSVWASRTYGFTANSSAATLTFRDLSASGDNLDLLLDNVRVTPSAPVNTAPVAVADSYSTNQGVALIVPAAGVLANDTDAQSNPLTAILNVGPTHGTLSLNTNGSFTYTPAAGYTGADSFTYRANDGSLSSNIATVSLTVNVVNTAPVAVADSYSTNQNTALVVPAAGVLSNDTDAQSNPLTAVLSVGPAHGTLTLNSNGGFTYTPTTGYTGADSFTYRANDGSLSSNIATVSLTVNVVNTAPVAVADSYSTNQGVALVVPAAGVLSNDTDAQSNPLTAVLSVGPAHGTLTLNSNGGFTYTPTTGYTGPDSFTYRANDGSLSSNIATVSLTVNVVNTAPVAVADNYSTNQGVALVVPAKGVLANDTDAQSNPLTANLSAGPGHGTLTLNSNGGFTYTPTAGYSGPDSFTYRANDGSLNSNVATVSITVNALNTAPVAVADSYSTNQNTALVVPAAGVLTNDTDAQSNPLTAVLSAGPAHGTLTLNPNGGFIYTSTTGYTGADSFTYRANDGSLNSNVATVSLTVNVVNTAPVAANDSYSTNQGVALVVPAAGVLANDTDAQSNPLTAVLGAGPAHGTLTLNPNGGFTYTPATGYTGADSFTYRANDGSLNSNIATVSLTVNVVNTAPVAANDSYSTNQGVALVVAAPGVLANDADAQSNALTASLNASPAHGTVTLNANGGFTYTPASGYAGADSFTYRASDGTLNSNIATVSITVSQPSANVLVNGSFESAFNGWNTYGNQTIESALPYKPTDGAKLAAFNSKDKTPNAVLWQTFPTVVGETYTLELDVGLLSYVKKHQKMWVSVWGGSSLVSDLINIKGDDDGDVDWTSEKYTFVANSTTAVLAFIDRSTTTNGIDLLLDNVRITRFQAPVAVAVADSYLVNRDTPLVVAAPGVLANDTIPSSGTTTAVIEGQPSHGSVTLSSNGGFTYTPAAGYSGADSFTYRARTGSVNSNAVSVNITINDVAAGSLTNPSFESDFASWTSTGNQSIQTYLTTHGTRQVAFNSENKTPNGVLSQTFTTKAGQTYSLAFDTSVVAYTTDSQTLQVTVKGSATLLSRTVTLIGTGNGPGPWLAQNFSFTADSTSTTLTFRDQSTATTGIDLLLDHVRVTPLLIATASVPVPTAEELPVPTVSHTSEAVVIRTTAIENGDYVLERSEDLQNWEYVDYSECTKGETVEFYDVHDSLGTEPPKTRMFYRIGFPGASQTE